MAIDAGRKSRQLNKLWPGDLRQWRKGAIVWGESATSLTGTKQRLLACVDLIISEFSFKVKHTINASFLRLLN
jgi:hypothetical protein